MSIFARALKLEIVKADRESQKQHREEKEEQAVMKEQFHAEQIDVGFREEVIAELVASGFAPHVAANLTDTPAKLMAKAREIEYI